MVEEVLDVAATPEPIADTLTTGEAPKEEESES
jgi:hypothetical protein